MAEPQNEAEAAKLEDKASSARPINPVWAAFWTALTYLIGVLVVSGGAGIWLPWVLSKPLSIDALTTYVFALLAPVVADLLLDLDNLKRSFSKFARVLFFSSCVIAGALAVSALLRATKSGEWESGWVAVFLSLVIWVAVALKTDRFRPEGLTNTGSIGGTAPTIGTLAGPGLTEG